MAWAKVTMKTEKCKCIGDIRRHNRIWLELKQRVSPGVTSRFLPSVSG